MMLPGGIYWCSEWCHLVAVPHQVIYQMVGLSAHFKTSLPKSFKRQEFFVSFFPTNLCLYFEPYNGFINWSSVLKHSLWGEAPKFNKVRSKFKIMEYYQMQIPQLSALSFINIMWSRSPRDFNHSSKKAIISEAIKSHQHRCPMIARLCDTTSVQELVSLERKRVTNGV